MAGPRRAAPVGASRSAAIAARNPSQFARWVLGMAWAFGALLPTFIGTGIVALSAGVHWVAWQVLKRFWPNLGSASSAK